MATNLMIDTELLNEALEVGGHRTKRDTVNEALREYVNKRKASEVLSLFGTVDYDADYDYKESRNRSKSITHD